MARLILPPNPPSLGAEQSIAKIIEGVVAEAMRFARAEIVPLMGRPRLVGDAFVVDRFERIFAALRAALESVTRAARALIEPILRLEDGRNEQKLNSALRRTLGIDLGQVVRKENIEAVIENAAERHVSLIRGLSAEVAKRIELTVLESAMQGETARTLAARLIREQGFGKRRARLIARDQLGKFSGELNRVRQEALGITSYIWDTSQDERVRGNPDGRYPNARPSHFDREGKVFSWKKPPEGGHPGEAINCRCTARGVIEEPEPIRRRARASGFQATEVRPG